ncbi:uncharacterized protein MKK02DRAFT_41425 [Dioszegia hungarica]|uniref:CWF21 domain-containing protein n=1 Tax=Dioszegia hungarica TaxID=4972 RepID=A0AA38LPC1_9TREE|nr:uncharacterized protein MKK02DRAFT_41425 [Dioszegia hungarica]KAI9631797.1 hypothetical protein MKK02DRAFT_41425 [Dioszegia hungarica]
MTYNGVGLQTARGSGTNAYVSKNNAHLRIRDGPAPGGGFGGGGGKGGRYGDFIDEMPGPVHRQPDAGILEHEKKRRVEVKCFELREELEEKGLDDDAIEEAVSTLRTTLSAQSHLLGTPRQRMTDSHSIAAAKQVEMSRLGRALGVSANHVEGKAFQRETEEERANRMAEREIKVQERAEREVRREIEMAKQAEEASDAAKKRRREEYYEKMRKEKADKEAAERPPAPAPYGERRGREVGLASSTRRSRSSCRLAVTSPQTRSVAFGITFPLSPAAPTSSLPLPRPRSRWRTSPVLVPLSLSSSARPVSVGQPLAASPQKGLAFPL